MFIKVASFIAIPMLEIMSQEYNLHLIEKPLNRVIIFSGIKTKYFFSYIATHTIIIFVIIVSFQF
jgi:hypothetical protein